MDSDPAVIRDAVERWRSRRDELEPLLLVGLSALLRGSWSPTLVQRIEAPVLEHATLAIRATAMLESFAGPGVSDSQRRVGRAAPSRSGRAVRRWPPVASLAPTPAASSGGPIACGRYRPGTATLPPVAAPD